MTSVGIDERRSHRAIPSFAKIVMLAQMVVNLFLSLWIYEEYLNNQYLRVYVNDSLQTVGWAIAAVIVAVALGALTIVLFRRKQNIVEKVEVAPIEVRVPVEIPVASPKPVETLHPVVASLKAELSHGRVPIGVVPAIRTEPAAPMAGEQVPVVPGSTTSNAPMEASPSPATVVVKKEPEKPAENKSSSQYEDKTSSQ